MSTEVTLHNPGALAPVLDPGVSSVPDVSRAHAVAPATSAYAALDSRMCDAFWNDVGRAGVTDRRLKPIVQAAFDKAAKQIEAEEIALDERDCASTQASLRGEWGASYADAVTQIKKFVNTDLPGALADAIWDGRAADGKLIGNNPAVMRWLLTLARGEGKPTGDINRELAEIEKTMRTNRTRYNRDAQMQARYLELISMRTR